MFRLVLFIVCVISKTDFVQTEYVGPVGSVKQFRKGSAVEDIIQERSKTRSSSGAGENEITEIRLQYNYDTNPNFTVWKDEPLKIIIENGFARYIWCFNKYAILGGPPPEKFVPDTEFANNIVNILYVKAVTAEMSTRWGCTVLQEYHGPSTPYPYNNLNYTAKDLHFHLYVKGARQVILTANNQNVKYDVKTNLSVEYYELASYFYEDGEDVEFSCRKAHNHTSLSDTVRLEYFNAEGILLFQSTPVTKLNKFHSVLNSTNDKYYLDCIYHSDRTGPVRENRYRTVFYMNKKDPEEHAIKLYINGHKLATFLNNETTIDDYIFKYIDGEILNITCQKIHYYSKGTLHFSFDRNLNYQEDRSNQEMGIISLKLLTSNLHSNTLTCSINNTEIQKPTARILFLTDVPDNDIRVRGLPRNNVLYQYTNGINQWTIEYQYSVLDTISLTCVANSGVLSPGHRQGLRNSPLFQWKFEGVTIDSPANWTQTLPSIKTSDTITKILNARNNGTKIMCTYFPKGKFNIDGNKTIEIILRLKPEQSVFVREKNSEEVHTDSYDHIMISSVITFAVAVAITTMLCVICWRKRTKRVNLIENAYDNLSIQNDSPIPAFPSQWESNYDDSHYTNIDEGVMQENYNYATDENNLYKTLYKRASNNSENHYSEIDDYFKTNINIYKTNKTGLTANCNSNQPSNYINTSILKGTASHNPNNAVYNNSQGTYDKLMQNNLYINKDNKNYSNLQNKGKNKSVTFRQMSNDRRLASKYNKGSSRKECMNNDQRLQQNSGGQYVNVQPGDMQKKPNNENNFLKNKETVNQSDSDYAEPYGEPGISCKKGFKL